MLCCNIVFTYLTYCSEGHCEALRQKITDDKTHPPGYYDPHYQVKETQGTSAIGAIDEDEVFVSVIT